MEPPFPLPFQSFWNWLIEHPNCLLRAGTPEAILYDDEDLHWNFAAEGDGRLLIQVLRGKRLAGELLLDPEQVTYVEGVPSEVEGEHLFELISETPSNRVATYFFALVHAYEDEREPDHGRVH